MSDTADVLLAEASAALGDVLAASRTVRVPLGEIWRMAFTADRLLVDEPGNHRILLARLLWLRNQGVLEFPAGYNDQAGRARSRAAAPPLPSFIRLRREEQREAAAVKLRQRAWDPAIWAWLREATDLSARDVERLASIDAWLAERGGDGPVVPVAERSLEVFGHERVLGTLARDNARLFAEGRLGLAMLRCEQVVAPPLTHRLSDARAVLVIENSATWYSFSRLLPQGGAVGAVVWGMGQSFMTSVLALSAMAPTAIVYFGDLDGRGLLVPIRAGELGARSGLPTIRPATGLYSLLLEHGREGQSAPVAEEAADTLVGWLDARHRPAVRSLLVRGRRLAQEAVGTDLLTSLDLVGDRLAALTLSTPGDHGRPQEGSGLLTTAGSGM